MKKLYVILFTLIITALIFSSCDGKRRGSSMAALTPFGTQQTNQPRLQEEFRIFNNPASSRITVFYNAPEPGKGLVKIYFPDGKILSRKEVIITKGINTWEFYFPANASGVFFLEFTTKKMIKTAKVVKT